ncbi:MAG TPA: nuclear transport factor 2 family protein [Acidimicrobiia bacterium]|nr:nuclear transport factor 2 family protein [Acidimicrobiia bacterium]
MTHEQVQSWLDDYIAAWASNAADQIGRLFTDDVVYSYRPWRDDTNTVTGRDAVVASWQEDPDDPAGWEAEYAPYAVDDDKAVAVGWTRYFAGEDEPERVYHNAFLLRFDDEGRCAEFAEFYVREKKA